MHFSFSHNGLRDNDKESLIIFLLAIDRRIDVENEIVPICYREVESESGTKRRLSYECRIEAIHDAEISQCLLLSYRVLCKTEAIDELSSVELELLPGTTQMVAFSASRHNISF